MWGLGKEIHIHRCLSTLACKLIYGTTQTMEAWQAFIYQDALPLRHSAELIC